MKFSFERIADPDLGSPWAYQFEQLDHVEVIDARNGIIHLKKPYQPIFVTSLPYYGGHIISRAGTEKAGGKFTTEPPATCGPYLFADWQQKQKVTLTANPDWPGPKPDFGKVEIYIVSDDQAAQLAYEADAFDYTKIAISATKAVKANPPADTTVHRGAVDALCLADHQHAEPAPAGPEGAPGGAVRRRCRPDPDRRL